MSRRRNWDKVRRERRVYLNGSLPHWVDGWAASVDPGRPSALRLSSPQSQISDGVRSRNVSRKNFDSVTVLSLDYGSDGTLFPLPGGERVHVNEVLYTCPGIDHAWKQQVIDELRHNLAKEGGATCILKFLDRMFEIATLPSVLIVDDLAVYEFVIRKPLLPT